MNSGVFCYKIKQTNLLFLVDEAETYLFHSYMDKLILR